MGFKKMYLALLIAIIVEHTAGGLLDGAEKKLTTAQSDVTGIVKYTAGTLTSDNEQNKPTKTSTGGQGILSQIHPELMVENEDGTHPCDRACVDGEEPKYCYYNFRVEWYHSMSKACYNCPYDPDDCNRHDCIPADGVNRSLTVVNRKFPGPPIVVCEYDMIVVDVENNLQTEATTVHWHGMWQRATPYMDGVPYVTQCPIQPGNTFRYKYLAMPYGTQFWHAHTGLQRGDGMSGALVVRRPQELDQHGDLYDFDLTEHMVLITDWVHELGISKFTRSEHSNGSISSPTLLVNGLGRFKVFNETDDGNVYMNVSRFNVTQGSRYRFRLINMGFMDCPIEFSVDGHNITYIATDGFDFEPITAESLVTLDGERYDFILEANNEIDNYWLRFRGLSQCGVNFTAATQVAVLHYNGAPDVEPEGDLTWQESFKPGLQLNALSKIDGDNTTVSVSQLKGQDDFGDMLTDVLKEKPDLQVYIAFNFYSINSTTNFGKGYWINQVAPPYRTVTPQINHISYINQKSPLLSARPSNKTFCNKDTIDESCQTDYCACTHVIQVPLNAVLEMVLLDEGSFIDVNHPIHLHGHGFYVVAQRRLGNSTSADQVKSLDAQGLITRNLVNPPRKDTVGVPDGGITIVRVKAVNPGYWLLHCHIEFHFEVGMGLVFKVGEHDEMVSVPDHFPTCGDFTPEIFS